MKDRLAKTSIEIRRSNISRYGVFASKNFRKGEIIEECPFLLLKDVPAELTNYTYRYDDDPELTAIPFGYGCLYNHAELPNAAWKYEQNNQIITFRALKSIHVGEEILTYYSPVWFPLRSIAPKTPYSLKNLAALSARIIFILILFFIVKMALFPSSQLQQKSSAHSDSMSKNINAKKTFITQKYSLIQRHTE